MKRFTWVSWWLELWLEIAWFPLLVVFLIVVPFRSILNKTVVDEADRLALLLYFILLGLLLGAVLSFWAAVREARKHRLAS